MKMAILGNSLLRRTLLEQQRSEDIGDKLERLEEDIRRLKIDFDIFFNGGTKKPPQAAKASLEARISRLNGNRELSFSYRYKLNTLISRYNSYRHLWRRKLREKGEEVI